MVKTISVCGLAVIVAVACGSDPDPKEACNQLVDAFAQTWDRCKVESYDAAKSRFTQAFSSCSPSSVDQGKVDQCSNDLHAADCNVIKGGSWPPSCTNALQ